MTDTPIIVKKIKKGGHGHHGGAWKVAYADFVTAMMAFFLLLWLLNAVTEEQLQGISNYFAPAAASNSTSGAGDILGGASMAVEGALPSPSGTPTVAMELPPPKAGKGPTEDAQDEPDRSAAEVEAQTAAAAAAEAQRQQEEEQFQEAKKEILGALKDLPEAEQLLKSLRIDSTPEGLRIQIIDQDGLAMFPRGGAKMFDHTRNALQSVSNVIGKMSQNVQITGHTDSTPFGSASGYTNWELSADRANATRRALIDSGIPPDRLARVVGVADREPLTDDPSAPSNRRIAVTLLRGTGKKTKPEEAVPEAAPDGAPATAPNVAPAPPAQPGAIPPARGTNSGAAPAAPVIQTLGTAPSLQPLGTQQAPASATTPVPPPAAPPSAPSTQNLFEPLQLPAPAR